MKWGHKYGAKQTEVDGHIFPSKAEAKRYIELKLLERAGQISNLRLQPKYEILPKFKSNQAIHYIGDFEYIENGKKVVEDVKGVKTAVYRLKKKMFEYKYPDIELREVS